MRQGILFSLALGATLQIAIISHANVSNDACSNAEIVDELPFQDTVDLSDATPDPDSRTSCGFGALTNPGVWYRFTAPRSMTIDVDTTGSDLDAEVGAFAACGGSELACNEDTDDDTASNTLVGVGPDGHENNQARMLLAVEAGQTVWIRAGRERGVGDRLVVNIRESAVFQVGRWVEREGMRVDLARSPDGSFVAVWRDANAPQGPAVLGQRLDANGAPLGDPFQINETDELNSQPAVAVDAAGNFAVMWMTYYDGIRVRRMDSDGNPISGEITVTSQYGTYPEETAADVASDSDGNFIVVWGGYDGYDPLIFGQRFDPSANPTGPQFTISDTDYLPRRFDPSIDAHSDGSFDVAWTADHVDGSGYGVVARRIDNAGVTTGPETLVNVETQGEQWFSDVTALPDGGFVVSWVHESFDCLEGCVKVRRFDASGNPVSGEQFVSRGPDGIFRNRTTVEADANGGFVVTWNEVQFGPQARRFDASGAPRGDEMHLPHLPADGNLGFFLSGGGYPKIAVAPDGDFMVVWHMHTFDTHGVVGRSVPTQEQLCSFTAQPDCKQTVTPRRARLNIGNRQNNKGDTISLKWVKGEATTLEELGEPLSEDGYALCVYDSSGDDRYTLDVLVAAARAPAGGICSRGKPCWKSKNARGYVYADRDATPDGLKKLVLKPGAEGKGVVFAQGKGRNLRLRERPLVPPVKAQIKAANGQCWEATFSEAGIVRNTVDKFSARSD